jgi:hypothetical protein
MKKPESEINIKFENNKYFENSDKSIILKESIFAKKNKKNKKNLKITYKD